MTNITFTLPTLPASILSLSLLFSSSLAFAGASEVQFTPEEISANRQNAKLISESAAACISRTWDTHNKFYKQRGYSKYYGNRKPEHKTEAGRKAVLLQLLPQLATKVSRNDRIAIAELDKRAAELEAMSCIGLTLKCLGEGFQTAGMGETWSKIHTWVGRIGPDGAPLFYGTDLQKALVDLGWKSVYWNPDIDMNQEWDTLEAELNPLQEGKKWNPIWGGHVYRWSLVKRNRDYYGVPVQDIQTLVNFGTVTPADFKAVPFFVGTAHAGYHVFPGFKGNVIEAHSMRNLKSISNLEVGPFNPLNQEINGIPGGTGAPRWTNSEHYRSGVIVVPPGMLADKPFAPPGPSNSTPPNGTPRPDGLNPPLDLNPGNNRNIDPPAPLDPWSQPAPRRRDRFLPPWLR